MASPKSDRARALAREHPAWGEAELAAAAQCSEALAYKVLRSMERG